MALSHRLHSPMDQRPDVDIERPPKRIVFLSVEGSETERQYFQFIEKYRHKLSIRSVIHVEVLSRWGSDTKSNPLHVYGLMQDYMEIRDKGILPVDIYERLSSIIKKDYPIEKIKEFMDSTLDQTENKRLQSDLKLAKIDYDYQKFLSSYKGEDGNDVFAIVIDRDKGSNSEDDIRQLYKICEENGLRCFISNPCFEFWLLLHICDVEQEMSEHQQDLLDNVKISNKHTYVSSELSKRAHHTKGISERKFIECYLNNVDTAIKRAKRLGTDANDLLNNLGSNLPILFEILREQ